MFQNFKHALLIALSCFLGSASCIAGNSVYLGNATANNSVSMNQVDHSVWNRLLQSHVSEAGIVDYKGWLASTADVRALDQYLNHLSGASQTAPASIEAKLAFWINAYNAVTVKGILREYPTTSIRNHTAKVIGYNIWDDLQLLVGGKAVSLNQMEHEILRKMNEPRIHFAIVCASTSCPRLLNQAYAANTIDQQLTLNAKHFFSQPANFKVNGNSITISAILNWFGEDFGNNQNSLIRRIAPWLPAGAASSIDPATAKLNYAEYDWSLNGI